MVNLEDLTTRGLRAYERGRIRMALRALLVLVPLSALCLLESRGRASCSCAATALIAIAVVMRWRDRRGVEAITTGMLGGLLPLGAGLMFERFGLDCEPTICAALALVVGGTAGMIVGLRSRGAALPLAAATIAALATSLGCIRLGPLGLGAPIAGIAIGLTMTISALRALRG
jgi:hypothetical protein